MKDFDWKMGVIYFGIIMVAVASAIIVANRYERNQLETELQTY